jgi:hypothetical protein
MCFSAAAEEPAQPVGKYDRRDGGVVLVGVYLDGDVKAGTPPSPELFGESEEVVHHVEVCRRRFAGMAVGEVAPLKASTLVGLEPTDAEEGLEVAVGWGGGPFRFPVEKGVAVPEQRRTAQDEVTERRPLTQLTSALFMNYSGVESDAWHLGDHSSCCPGRSMTGSKSSWSALERTAAGLHAPTSSQP